MSPRLKNQSETENESRTSRSRFRTLSGRRRSASPSRKTTQKPSQIGTLLICLPPKAPSPPRAIFHATCGPVQASVTSPLLVVDAAGRDLAGGAPPDADLPVAPLLVEGRVGDAIVAPGSGRASRRPSRRARKIVGRLLLGQACRLDGRRERRLDERPCES